MKKIKNYLMAFFTTIGFVTTSMLTTSCHHQDSNFETFHNFLIDANKDGHHLLDTTQWWITNNKKYYGSIALDPTISQKITTDITNITDSNNKLITNFQGAFQETVTFAGENTVAMIGLKGNANENVNDMFKKSQILLYTWNKFQYYSDTWDENISYLLHPKMMKELTAQKSKITNIFNHNDTGDMQYKNLTSVSKIEIIEYDIDSMNNITGHANITFNAHPKLGQLSFPITSYTGFISMQGLDSLGNRVVLIHTCLDFKTSNFTLENLTKSSFKNTYYTGMVSVVSELENFSKQKYPADQTKTFLDIWQHNFTYVDNNNQIINKDLTNLENTNMTCCGGSIFINATFMINHKSKTIKIRTASLSNVGFRSVDNPENISFIKFDNQNYDFSSNLFNKSNIGTTMNEILNLHQEVL